MAEKNKDRLSFLLDSYLQGRENSTELLYGGRSAAAQHQEEENGGSTSCPSAVTPGPSAVTPGPSAVTPGPSVTADCTANPDEASVSGSNGVPNAVVTSGSFVEPEISDLAEACVSCPSVVADSSENVTGHKDRVLSILDGFLEETGAGGDALELGMPAQDYVRNYLENMPDAPVTGLEKDIRSKTGMLLDAFLSAGSEKLNIGRDAVLDWNDGAEKGSLTGGKEAASAPVNPMAGAVNPMAGAGNSVNGAVNPMAGAGNPMNGAGNPMAGAGGFASDSSGDSDDSDDFDLNGRTNRFEEAFFTETLAEIFMKQHRYDKALEIIRSLYLNFPNKSIYFADQIRYLEKLIRINQISK